MKNQNSLRTNLGRVRGVGSAHSGTHHFLMQRVSAVILALVGPLLGYGFVTQVIHGTYESAFNWIHYSPITGALFIIFIMSAFYHALLGVQTVVQDYIHCDVKKLITIFVIKFLALLFVIIGIVAVLHIQFASALAHD